MKNLNICIDIDGTITDPYYWLNRANVYFNKNIKPCQVTEYPIDKVMGVTREEYCQFYEKNRLLIHEDQALRPDVREVIRELYNNNNIYFITAREKDMEILTYQYLNKYRIPYDDLFLLGSSYKSGKARDLECNVFIEDCYENAVKLAEDGFKVLLIDTNYNRKSLTENMERVFNWKQIYEIIEKMLLQSKAV